MRAFATLAKDRSFGQKWTLEDGTVSMQDNELNRTTLFGARKPQTHIVAHALLLRQEGSPPRRVSLPLGTTNIGRDPANELVLASSEVSRKHCGINVTAAGTTLTDFASTNGVYVDGVRINAMVLLHPGARIVIGQFNLTYQRGTTADLAEAEANERELSNAVEYIRALLPKRLREGPVRTDWRFVPSTTIGGDAFGYRWLDDQRLSMFLLDVCGHGVGSALLAVSAANMMRATTPGIDLGSPAKVLRGLNAAFQMEEHHGLFFTLWYGLYDISTRSLSYASAGHHAAYLESRGSFIPLATSAPAIGMAPSLAVEASSVTVARDSRLHLFSDGAFEVTRTDGKVMGIDNLLALFKEVRKTGYDLGQVYDDLRTLTGHRPFEDDLSLLAFEFR